MDLLSLLESTQTTEKLPVDSRASTNTKNAKRKHHSARPLQFPRDRLAITFQQCRQASSLSLARLAETSGIDVAHIWRIEQGEHQNVSREILILLSMAMVLDAATVDRVVEVANEILDAAGLKMLRAPWENAPGRKKLPDAKSQ